RCAGGRDVVPVVAECAVARYGGDDPAGVHLADAPIAKVHDIEVARAVHRHAIGLEEFRAGGWTVVPAIAPGSVARHRGNDAAGVHLADALVIIIHDIEVARAVHRHAIGTVEFRAGGWDVVPVV